jgi:hypothetical protein
MFLPQMEHVPPATSGWCCHSYPHLVFAFTFIAVGLLHRAAKAHRVALVAAYLFVFVRWA